MLPEIYGIIIQNDYQDPVISLLHLTMIPVGGNDDSHRLIITAEDVPEFRLVLQIPSHHHNLFSPNRNVDHRRSAFRMVNAMWLTQERQEGDAVRFSQVRIVESDVLFGKTVLNPFLHVTHSHGVLGMITIPQRPTWDHVLLRHDLVSTVFSKPVERGDITASTFETPLGLRVILTREMVGSPMTFEDIADYRLLREIPLNNKDIAAICFNRKEFPSDQHHYQKDSDVFGDESLSWKRIGDFHYLESADQKFQMTLHDDPMNDLVRMIANAIDKAGPDEETQVALRHEFFSRIPNLMVMKPNTVKAVLNYGIEFYENKILNR